MRVCLTSDAVMQSGSYSPPFILLPEQESTVEYLTATGFAPLSDRDLKTWRVSFELANHSVSLNILHLHISVDLLFKPLFKCPNFQWVFSSIAKTDCPLLPHYITSFFLNTYHYLKLNSEGRIKVLFYVWGTDISCSGLYKETKNKKPSYVLFPLLLHIFLKFPPSPTESKYSRLKILIIQTQHIM